MCHPRPSISVYLIVAALSLQLGCAGDENGGGNGGPTDLQALDTEAPTIVRELDANDDRLRFNPSQFRVKQNLTLVFSTRTELRGPDGFAGDLVDEVRDAIYAFDYGTGMSRELVRASNEDRFVVPLPVSIDQGLLYYATIPEDTENMRVTGLDPWSGAFTGETEIDGVFGNCFVAAGGDLYFDSGGLSLVAARDFIDGGRISTFDPIGDAELCRTSEGLASLDGTAVLVEAPTALDPMVDTIRLVALDPASGAPEPTPLLSVPVSSVSLGTEGERPPVLAVEDDGLYVLASDFLAMEVWFVPYDRRPGEGSSTGSGAPPERLARIEVPFFADVIPTEGPLGVFDPAGLAAVDGVVALPVIIEEQAGDGRFFWGFLVMIDAPNQRYDLLLFSNATRGLVDMIPTAR